MNANGRPCHPRTGPESPEGEAAATFKIAAVASADNLAFRANMHTGYAAGLRCSAATLDRHATGRQPHVGGAQWTLFCSMLSRWKAFGAVLYNEGALSHSAKTP
jgi:hypothetical protein